MQDIQFEFCQKFRYARCKLENARKFKILALHLTILTLFLIIKYRDYHLFTIRKGFHRVLMQYSFILRIKLFPKPDVRCFKGILCCLYRPMCTLPKVGHTDTFEYLFYTFRITEVIETMK